MQFTVLASGSAGNSVLVQAGRTRILLEAGLSLQQTRRRAATLDLDLDRVDGIFVTHEHSDHVAHAGPLSRGLRAPLYMNRGTQEASGRFLSGECDIRSFHTGETIRVGDLEIETHRKPHDAADPVTFLVRHEAATLGLFTDLGHVDAGSAGLLARCTALVLEANHDPELLEQGPYPPALKRRVAGGLGHLNNEDAARSLATAAPSLTCLVLAHLSEQNNDPARVRAAFLRHGGVAPGYQRWISSQHRATPLWDATGTVTRRPRRGPETPEPASAPDADSVAAR